MRMFTLEQVKKAAKLWYNSDDINSCCIAENRLMAGEEPEGFNND